jgi:hypothetical protein
VKTLVKTRVTGKVEPKAELPQVGEAISELEEAIGVVLQYVEDVLGDRTPPDNSIGRNLLKLVGAVPNMTREDLDNMMSANIKVKHSKYIYTLVGDVKLLSYSRLIWRISES